MTDFEEKVRHQNLHDHFKLPDSITQTRFIFRLGFIFVVCVAHTKKCNAIVLCTHDSRKFGAI